MPGAVATLGGTARVYCVHDREKRLVITASAVAALAADLGIRYIPALHKLHLCACCDNLFVDGADTPQYCHACQRPNTHPLGGPLPDPIGVVL